MAVSAPQWLLRPADFDCLQLLADQSPPSCLTVAVERLARWLGPTLCSAGSQHATSSQFCSCSAAAPPTTVVRVPQSSETLNCTLTGCCRVMCESAA